MTVRSGSDEGRKAAERRLEQGASRKRDGEKALAEYEAAKKQERAKTAKLRALRLAKEEADKKAAADKGAATKASPTPKRK